MARNLNKVLLIGNLTRDPELRYTPQGTAVCTFGLATNRQWTTEAGEKKEEVEFHRIVAWNKLAEICAQLLKKGNRVYLEGRLQTRTWTGNDNVKRSQTEIVITDMILLDAKGGGIQAEPQAFDIPEEELSDLDLPPVDEEAPETVDEEASTQETAPAENDKEPREEKELEDKEEDSEEDLPF